MESSLLKATSYENTVFKGKSGKIRECVTGRLFFAKKGSDGSERFPPKKASGAKIAVGTTTELDMFFSNIENAEEFVAAVLINTLEDISLPINIESLNIPILSLPYLSNTLDGKIAILDTNSSSLFVDPDIDAVERYTRTLDKNMLSTPNIYAPASYFALSKDNKKAPVGVLHICSAGSSGELRSEEELFDDYRELCESTRPIPITLMLCPAFPFENDSKERFHSHVKAIFRASVYGKTRILCGGPCISTTIGILNCIDEIKKIKDISKKQSNPKWEYNSNIPCGFLISNPLTLFSLGSTNIVSIADFICLDLNKLAGYTVGESHFKNLRTDAVDEFFALLKKAISNTKRINTTVCATANKSLMELILSDKELELSIDELFVKNDSY